MLVLLAGSLALIGGTSPWHPDSLTKRSLAALAAGGNPGFFRYPGGLLIHLHNALYAAVYGALSLFGWIDEPGAQALFANRPALARTIGHFTTVGFSVIGVVLCHRLVHLLTRDRCSAFVGAFLLSTSILWVADSHFVTVDVPLAVLALGAVYLTLRSCSAAEPLGAARASAVGLMIGLTASIKYPGGLVALVPLVVSWPCYRGRRRRWVVHTTIAAMSSAAAFLATNPFLLVSYGTFRRDLSAEVAHATRGHFGYQQSEGWPSFFASTMTTALGVPATLLAVAGLLFLVSTRSVPGRIKAGLLIWPLSLLLLLASTELAFQRYLLPILPFAAVLAGVGAHAVSVLGTTAARWSPRRSGLLVSLAAVVAAGPQLAQVIRHDVVLSAPDTRSILRSILERAELDVDTTVYAGTYAAAFGQFRALRAPGELARGAVDLVVFDSFSHDRLLYAGARADQRPRDIRKDLVGSRIGRFHVLSISPFTHPKLEVPFSPKSLYSPYPPDLGFRRAPGPYIEIYIRDRAVARRLARACRGLALPCGRSRATSGYYLRALKARRR